MTDLAEKYLQKARDSQNDGGSSLAEKYLNIARKQKPQAVNEVQTTASINNESGLDINDQQLTDSDYILDDQAFSEKVYNTYNPNNLPLDIPDGQLSAINNNINQAFKDREKFKEANKSTYQKVDEVVTGAGETALAIGSSATTGIAGMTLGTVQSIAKQLWGKFVNGDEWNPDLVEQEAAKAMQAASYTPKSKKGQQYTKAIGDTLQPLEALTPAVAEIGALARNATSVIPRVSKTTQVADVDIGKEARKAALGNEESKRIVLDEAKLDSKAIDAASNLDIDLPIDLFSQNEYIKQLAGQVRGLVAGDESVKFAESIQTAVTKADDALESIGGTPDIAGISNRVKSQLDNSISSLKTQASELYKNVDKNIPKTTEVNSSNLYKVLNSRVKELGGEQWLSPQEKRLLKSLDGMTYGRLMSVKSDIGSALGSKISQSPFSSVNEGTLKRLYGAIANDQMDAVKVMDLGGDLKLANQLTAKRKGLEKRVVQTFGKEGQGSIAQTLKTAITEASKGDVKNLNKVIKAVPKELRKEALATALSSLSQTNRANQSGFNFSSYNKTYRGLRQNPSVYKKIVDEMGEGSHEVLRDLFHVSRAISDATSRVSKTGQSNQILQQATAENILVRFVDRTVGIVDAVSSRATMGVSGDKLFSKILTVGRTDKKQALAALFRDESFKEMMKSSARTGIKAKSLNGLKKSAAFKRWAKKIGYPTIQPEALIIIGQDKDETTTAN